MTGHPAAHEALIEAYVLDVTRRLPGKQRNDVAFELRALLAEGLRDRADAAGRAPDEAMALDFVRDFGRPGEVAARYSPPGDPLLPPAQTPGFALATVIGVAIQWSVSLPLAFSGQLAPAAPESARFASWWLSYGLGAFWWPGFLISIAMIAGWVRQRWPAANDAWKPRVFDRDSISRPLYALGIALALCGVGLWVAIAWFVANSANSTNPVARALAFDGEFLATRAPVLLLYWAAGISVLLIVIIEGQWRSLTRRINTGIQLVGCALLLWFILGGRIFTGDPADQAAKPALMLIVGFLLIQLAVNFWRRRSRIRPPGELARPT
jgi:hypothetical protein